MKVLVTFKEIREIEMTIECEVDDIQQAKRKVQNLSYHDCETVRTYDNDNLKTFILKTEILED